MNQPPPQTPSEPPRDVRMRGFAARTTVEAAIAWLDARAAPLEAEAAPLDEAAGRVLAADVTSGVDVPSFDRAMMDGYAVRAADVLGASTYAPAELAVVGEVLPGRAFAVAIAPREAVRIMTGAAMPPASDAVVPAEYASESAARVAVTQDVSPGKHVGLRGEDVRRGERVLTAGRRLRPQDVGLLASIGCAAAPVVRRPRVHLVITGDELATAGDAVGACRVIDANGPMLAALVARDGGLVTSRRIVRDDAPQIEAAMLAEADVTIVSGGSSVGQEDHAPPILARHGELAVHGVAMRPSSPSGFGCIGRRLVFLLPGNPVSCLCAYDFFAGRAIRALGGLPRVWPYTAVRRRLGRKLTSVVGRVDYARVRIEGELVEPLAIGGASVLSSTTRADGFVVVPADSEGYASGAEVEVFLYG